MFLIILNKWSHLEDEDWQLTTTNVAKTTHTCNVLAVISPLKWSILTTIGPRTTRMMVYVCLLWQRLRHWFLPIATSNHLLSASSAQKFWVKSKYKLLHSMNVCVSCLTSVAWLTTQIFSFQPETLGKHWPTRNNLRVTRSELGKKTATG